MLFQMLGLEVKGLHCAYGVASHEMGVKFSVFSQLGYCWQKFHRVLDSFKVATQ